MNAWLSLVTGLKYVNISKTSPPDGVSNCGYWLTVQMAALQTSISTLVKSQGRKLVNLGLAMM